MTFLCKSQFSSGKLYVRQKMTFCYSGLDDNYNEYGERNLGTLPKDRTLGYGVPEQPAAYMSGPTDVSNH